MTYASVVYDDVVVVKATAPLRHILARNRTQVAVLKLAVLSANVASLV